jgi:hypothetical protein
LFCFVANLKKFFEKNTLTNFFSKKHTHFALIGLVLKKVVRYFLSLVGMYFSQAMKKSIEAVRKVIFEN